jgi:hypothetical protein
VNARAVAIALLVASTLSAAAPASAGSAGGSGGVDGHSHPHLSVGLHVYAPGSDGTTSYGPHDRNAPSPVRVEAVAAHSPGSGLENLCNAGNQPVTPTNVPWGWWYTVTTIDNATGKVLSTELVCVPLPPLSDPTAPPPPPSLPSPPTIADVWDAVGIPAPPIGVSPADEGVVGLGTWLWSGGATQVQVAVTLDGYTVSGTAHLVEYRFDGGDGASASAPGAGSDQHPAATHVYDRKGTYALSVASAWDAEVTMVGPGITTPVPIAIGRAVVTTTQDYPVVEVRSVLMP